MHVTSIRHSICLSFFSFQWEMIHQCRLRESETMALEREPYHTIACEHDTMALVRASTGPLTISAEETLCASKMTA